MFTTGSSQVHVLMTHPKTFVPLHTSMKLGKSLSESKNARHRKKQRLRKTFRPETDSNVGHVDSGARSANNNRTPTLGQKLDDSTGTSRFEHASTWRKPVDDHDAFRVRDLPMTDTSLPVPQMAPFVYGLLQSLFYTVLTKIAHVELKNFHKIPNGPCVFISNHASEYDTLLLLSVLPYKLGNLRVVANGRISRRGLIQGALTKQIGAIMTSGGDAKYRGVAIAQCIQALRQGLSVLIYPQGGVYPEESTKLIVHSGFGVIARAANVPIVPIQVSGCENVFKGLLSCYVKDTQAIVQVCDPVTMETNETLSTGENVTDIKVRCNNIMQKLMKGLESLRKQDTRRK